MPESLYEHLPINASKATSHGARKLICSIISRTPHCHAIYLGLFSFLFLSSLEEPKAMIFHLEFLPLEYPSGVSEEGVDV